MKSKNFARNDYLTINLHLIGQRLRSNISSGPKIISSSCGNVSIHENRAISNLLRVFSVNNEISTNNSDFKAAPLFYNIESRILLIFIVQNSN